MPRHMETFEAWSEIAAMLGEGDPVEDFGVNPGEHAFQIKLSDGCVWRYFVDDNWTIKFVYHPASSGKSY